MDAGPYEGLPTSLREVLRASDDLKARLLRVARALEISAEATAESLRASESLNGGNERLLLLAKRSREVSLACHDLVDRLS